MLREWYMKAFPTDDLGEYLNNLSFEEIYKQLYRGVDIYEVIGVWDSLVRERVFLEMSERFDMDPEVLYTMWLNNAGN